MSSFSRQMNQHGQFIIGMKIFPPVQSKDDFDRSAKSATAYRALVDTGANHCCISEKVVADLKLQAYSQSEMMTAGKPHIVSSYIINIAISVRETELRMEKQKDGQVVLKPHQVSEISKGFSQIKVSAIPDIGNDRGFDVILGMNILSHFHITMHQGTIIISI